MPIQVAKMILYGILHAILYIAVPLILFEILSILNIMTFTQEFKITIIIIGTIGVVFSMLMHAYPKDTSANRIIAFFSTIYSGFFLFYLFGGFTPGVQLGTYSISLSMIDILLGLQVFAWLLLGASAIRALQYFVEAIELRKKREYSIRKKFKLSTIFKALGIILSLIVVGYLGSIIYSATRLNFNIHDMEPTDIVYDNNGTPGDLSDDVINFTLTFDVINQGIYAIYSVYIASNIYTLTSSNSSALPEGIRIGGSSENYYGTYHSNTTTVDQQITANIDSLYVPGLATTNATLDLKISFTTMYAAIAINLNISIQYPWNAVI